MVFNPDRVNIHELTIEEPEAQSELPFDPERDITDDDWKKMKEKLEEFRQGGDFMAWHSFSWQAMEMKILDPKVDLNIDQAAWQGMENELKSYRTTNDWDNFLAQAMKMKIIDPCRDLNINQVAASGITGRLETYRNDDNNFNFLQTASRMKILGLKEGIDPDQSVRQFARKQLEVFARSEQWGFYFNYTRYMKILGLDQDMNLNAVIWQNLHDELKRKRSDNSSHDLARIAADMTTLAAEEVKVPPNGGLEVTMRKPRLDSCVPPIPETKKF